MRDTVALRSFLLVENQVIPITTNVETQTGAISWTMGKQGAIRNGEHYATAGSFIDRVLRAIPGSWEPADCRDSLNF
jgi:hypothetical protein